MATGAQYEDDPEAYWHRQLVFLTESTSWLRTIGIDQQMHAVLWSAVTPYAMTEGTCMIILDKPDVVFALRFLQGCGEQCGLNKVRHPMCILFGRLADLHHHLRRKSAADLCGAYGLHLIAAYSTSKPKCKRYVLQTYACCCGSH